MSKNYFGGAIINSGPDLPPAGEAPLGALFMKSGSAPGLYFFGYSPDFNPGLWGNQGSQAWQNIVDTTGTAFVTKTGDTMTGNLAGTAFRATQGAPNSADASTNGFAFGSDGDTGLFSVGSGNLGTSVSLYLNNIQRLEVTSTNVLINGNTVWHSGNDGSGSGLDADVLDGQDGSYYLSLANAVGTLPTSKGGTGNTAGANAGGIAYGTPSFTYDTTTAGAATVGSGTGQNWQVLTSGGTGTPAWVNSLNLNVAYANVANSANSATVASSATNVAWTGITGLSNALSSLQTFASTPVAGMTLFARPSLFYEFGNSGLLSPTPPTFPIASLSGFDGYTTSDMGSYQVGLTAMGTAGGGARGLQITADWNFEELTPTGLRFRVNDDTGTVGSWGPFQTLWDQGNLTNLNQLTNGPGYITSASLGNYVLRAGDTMTGGLVVQAGLRVGSGSTPAFGDLTINGNFLGGGYVSASGNVVTNGGNMVAGGTGVGQFIGGNSAFGGSLTAPMFAFSPWSGTGGASNGLYMPGANEVRLVVAGSFTTSFTLGTTAFSTNITATGNITAYSSDARLKKNVQPIADAVSKVVALGGYSYDWDLEKCEAVGFKPEREHEHGLIAQEVEAVMPDAVAPAPFNSEYKTVRYDRIVALLTAAIAQQQEMIEELKSKVAHLEGK